jgi:hypothetical protein
MKFRTVAVLASICLAACGGGGSDETSAIPVTVVDQYLGTWSYPCEVVSAAPGSEQSIRRSMTVTKVSSVSINVAPAELTFSTVDCTGPSTATLYSTALLTHTGTKVVGGEVVQTFLATGAGGSVKLFSLLKDGKLYGEDLASPLDGDGYHTAIDFTEWAVR